MQQREPRTAPRPAASGLCYLSGSGLRKLSLLVPSSLMIPLSILQEIRVWRGREPHVGRKAPFLKVHLRILSPSFLQKLTPRATGDRKWFPEGPLRKGNSGSGDDPGWPLRPRGLRKSGDLVRTVATKRRSLLPALSNLTRLSPGRAEEPVTEESREEGGTYSGLVLKQ